MSGGLWNLGLPPTKYRIDKASQQLGSLGFELAEKASLESATRVKLLLTTRFSSRRVQRHAEDLAERLSSSKHNCPTESLACPKYMRRHRLRITGHVWKLLDEEPDVQSSCFTLIPPSWRCSRDQLLAMDAGKMMKTIRTDLYRAGAGRADGWLIAFLHGENDPSTKRYQPHVHGIATGGMIDVIDKLRLQRKYFATDTVSRPVRRTRKPLQNLPCPITYMVQSYWPAKSTGAFDGVNIKRSRRKQRIPEPDHSHVLMWLDRHRLNDISLVIHVGVTVQGLQANIE